jgi:hypothetical protein
LDDPCGRTGHPSLDFRLTEESALKRSANSFSAAIGLIADLLDTEAFVDYTGTKALLVARMPRKTFHEQRGVTRVGHKWNMNTTYSS